MSFFFAIIVISNGCKWIECHLAQQQMSPHEVAIKRQMHSFQLNEAVYPLPNSGQCNSPSLDVLFYFCQWQTLQLNMLAPMQLQASVFTKWMECRLVQQWISPSERHLACLWRLSPSPVGWILKSHYANFSFRQVDQAPLGATTNLPLWEMLLAEAGPITCWMNA